MGDQREASVSHRAGADAFGSKERVEKKGGETNGEKGIEEETEEEGKQDFQSRPVIGCGISNADHRTGETKED